MGHQLVGGNSSWCPELEPRTTHPVGLLIGIPDLTEAGGQVVTGSLQLAEPAELSDGRTVQTV